MHRGEYWFSVEFCCLNCEMKWHKMYIYTTWTKYIACYIYFVFFGCSCIQNHPIYFCCENLHIASFDQMFNQNIRNGNWIILHFPLDVCMYVKQAGERERCIMKMHYRMYPLLKRKEEGFEKILMHFVRKKVHHITGRGYLLFQTSNPYPHIPAHTHTHTPIHSFIHAFITVADKSQENRNVHLEFVCTNISQFH